MDQEQIQKLFARFDAIAFSFAGVECWSARQLQEAMGYTRWDAFKKVVTKAKRACRNAGESVENHFPHIFRAILTRRKVEKQTNDILLTRYACYLVFQNGDSKIKEIAMAQSYFAVQARTAELIEKGLLAQQDLKSISTGLPSEQKLISVSGGKDMLFTPDIGASQASE